MALCRVCGIRADNYEYSIFSNVSGEQISKMIIVFTGIEIPENDQLTKHVCDICFYRFVDFVALRDDCINTQKALEALEDATVPRDGDCKLEIEYLYDEIPAEEEFVEQQNKDSEFEIIVTSPVKSEEPVVVDDDTVESVDELIIPIKPAGRSKKRRRSPSASIIKEVSIQEIVSISTGIKLGLEDLGCKQPAFEYKKYSSSGIKCCGCETVLQTEDDLIPHSQLSHEPNRKNFNKKYKQQCSFCFQLFHLNDPKIADHITVKYECEMCTLVYQSSTSYDEHLQKYHQELVFRCCGCTFECDTKEQLDTHSAIIHFQHRNKTIGLGEGKNECDICYKKIRHDIKITSHKSMPYRKAVENENELKGKEKEYLRCCGHKCLPIFDNEEQLQQHRKEVHLPKRISNAEAGENASFECKNCYGRFLNLASLKYHLKYNMKNPPRLIRCRYCSLTKKSLEEIKNHEKDHENPAPNERIVQIKKGKVKKVYNCSLCPTLLKSLEELHKHEEIHRTKGFKCCATRCQFSSKTHAELMEHGKEIHANNKKIYWMATEDRPFECNICYNSYKDKLTLKGHQRLPYKDSIFICDVCGFKSTKQVGLNHHYELKHGEVGSYPCKYCQKVFTKDLSCKKHETLHEMSEVKYFCKICEKGFRRPKLLVSHMRSHSSERNYKCKLCTKTYKRANHLAMHVRREHSKEKPVVCRYCDMRFYTTASRTKHEGTHSSNLKKNVCKYCEKCFAMRWEYVAHVERHIAEEDKEFACSKCPRKFSEKEFLDSHITYNHLEVAKKITSAVRPLQEWEMIATKEEEENEEEEDEDLDEEGEEQNEEHEGTPEEYLYDEYGDPVAAYTVIDGDVDPENMLV